MPLGLTIVKNYTFLELGDGREILSKGKGIDVPIVTTYLTVKMDLKVTSLLHAIDLILGTNWLQAINPLIELTSSRIFLPKEVGTSVLPSS